MFLQRFPRLLAACVQLASVISSRIRTRPPSRRIFCRGCARFTINSSPCDSLPHSHGIELPSDSWANQALTHFSCGYLALYSALPTALDGVLLQAQGPEEGCSNCRERASSYGRGGSSKSSTQPIKISFTGIRTELINTYKMHSYGSKPTPMPQKSNALGQ